MVIKRKKVIKKRKIVKRKTNIQKLREIVRKKQYQKIQGMIVDGISARLVLKVYDSLNAKNKKIYGSIINKNLKKAVGIAWKLKK